MSPNTVKNACFIFLRSFIIINNISDLRIFIMDFTEAYLDVIKRPHKFIIGDREYRIMDVAYTPVQLANGLMNTVINEDECMLFKFDDEKIRSFWMKNCVVPLTVLFLDHDRKVISIKHMDVEQRTIDERPEMYERRLQRYSSDAPAKYAVEIYQDKSIDSEIGSTAVFM